MNTFVITGRGQNGARIEVRLRAHSQTEAVELFAQAVPEVLQAIAVTDYDTKEVTLPTTNPVVQC